jgi:predicted DNA-binding ribbon-helix-helix protein
MPASRTPTRPGLPRHRLNVALAPALWRQLEFIADRDRLTLSHLVNQILTAYLNPKQEHEQVSVIPDYEAFKRNEEGRY